MFCNTILNQNILIGLKIPEYPIQRRVSKNVYINPEFKVDAVITL